MELSLRHYEEGHFREAGEICKEVLKVEPDNFMFLHFLGEINYRLGDYTSALENIKRSLEINPGNTDAYNNLGVVLKDTGQLDEAVMCYKKLLDLNPQYADAYANLGTIYRAKGKIDESESYYRHALEIDRNDYTTYSNLLFTMNYNSLHDPQTIYAEHLKFSELFESSLSAALMPHNNERKSDRRLRIGYVSPDFRRHSVNYFTEPVLASHNHEKFEIFCYSDVPIVDDVTMRLQNFADHWRNITGISDESAAELIRKDRIDILIDMAGHTGYNRILLFARKPAPVQVSWLGYPNTTGLSTIDCRIVDNYTDPPGLTEPF